ncbi:MAG: hypothetical protein AB8F78_08140 [Saprospiraceae bacterium]
MTLTLNRFYALLATLLLVTASSYAQSFEETWKEFLENNKVSNISVLAKPDKVFDKPDYAKYLLMNTNSRFCQSRVSNAEELLEELQAMDPAVHEEIPGFKPKYTGLVSSMKAYYSIDDLWVRFLKSKDVTLEQLEAVEGTRRLCEKGTAAKFYHMLAYHHLCQDEMAEAEEYFVNRTLKLAEKTSLKVEDIKGLAPEVKKMKALFEALPKLDKAWDTYIGTGESPGWDIELPVFGCNPTPNMKALVLQGAADLCSSGSSALKQIEKLQANSAVKADNAVLIRLQELEELVAEKDENIDALNTAWEDFLPDNKVEGLITYSYDFCEKEPLIRAHIMDGYAYVCELAESTIKTIDSLQRRNPALLDKVTRTKIKELGALAAKYRTNGEEIEDLWDAFVANGDTMTIEYFTTDQYCDHIQEVKDWTMQGLSGDCEEGIFYLGMIEKFNETFEFNFYEDLECRVQKLRIKIWDCRANTLKELARLEGDDDTYQARLDGLLEEYGVGPKPEKCEAMR